MLAREPTVTPRWGRLGCGKAPKAVVRKPSASAGGPMTIRDELLALERAGWESLCDGTGDEFYGNTMTDDALMVLANGMVMDRATVVESLADAPAWAGYEIGDPHLITVCDEAYALVYTGTGRRAGDDDFVGIMTSIYVRRDGAWKLAFYQQTPKG
jgi:hypothetical protein